MTTINPNNIVSVDVRLWVLLQNTITLPSDYLKETEEYELFKDAHRTQKTFSISQNDIFDDDDETFEFYHFDTFSEMMFSIKELYEMRNMTECKKYKLLVESYAAIERIALEDTFEKMSLR